MSSEFIFRIVGAILTAIGGAFLGSSIARYLRVAQEAYVIVFILLGFLVGLILTPYITIRPLRAASNRLAKMPAERLIAIVLGLFIGLVAAALLSLPLALLGSPFRQILPLVAAGVLCYLSVVILVSRQNDLQAFFSGLRVPMIPTASEHSATADGNDQFILLDTSVIIDGRIADISKTGFIRATLLIPNFILSELQHIADSADPLRRGRGRLGLEVLTQLQNETPLPTQITDMDVSEVRDADSKLVALARHLHCPIMTNDYNLNRVAELQGVSVLNINDLANAVKITSLPGEELKVKIIQEGRESDQGVGFLQDGTMVVVEDGRSLINKTLNVTVTKVLQTSAGRMIFAKP
ncbi:PIN/TRAM domain-containing protein [Candidatus Leptofilum sp.]|uniref:PIN/TRAM domain-containing protein n=1 Tax=Candidatus Leptofilum sp. TaxID=3241576 RepID=UPI003B5B4CF0